MVGVCSKIPIEERLANCSKLNPETGCIEWTGLSKHGYGIISYLGWQQLAHRLAYSLVHGPIPKGIFICHRCDNPACINVDHLFAGTPKDNSMDMARKGRATKLCGENASRAKLSEADALAIILSDQRSVDLARKYGITGTHVAFIRNGKAWKHLHKRLAESSNDPER